MRRYEIYTTTYLFDSLPESFYAVKELKLLYREAASSDWI